MIQIDCGVRVCGAGAGVCMCVSPGVTVSSRSRRLTSSPRTSAASRRSQPSSLRCQRRALLRSIRHGRSPLAKSPRRPAALTSTQVSTDASLPPQQQQSFLNTDEPISPDLNWPELTWPDLTLCCRWKVPGQQAHCSLQERHRLQASGLRPKPRLQLPRCRRDLHRKQGRLRHPGRC